MRRILPFFLILLICFTAIGVQWSDAQNTNDRSTDEKPTFSDSSRVDVKKTPGSDPEFQIIEETESLDIDDLYIYGNRHTVDKSEKELTGPPDILVSPRNIPVNQDKGILEIQQSLGQKSGPEEEGSSQLRKYLYRASAEFGTYTTIPVSFFHGNQVENFNYFLNLGFERSGGHTDHSEYQEAKAEGRFHYQIDETGNLSVRGSFFNRPYEMYGASSDLNLDRKRRFRMFEGSVNFRKTIKDKIFIIAGFSADKSYFKEEGSNQLAEWEDEENSFLTKLAITGLWGDHLVSVDALLARSTTDFHNGVSFGMNYFMIQPKWIWTPTSSISGIIGANMLGYNTDELGDTSKMLPYLKATYTTPKKIALSATFSSFLQGHSLKTYWRHNAFIDSMYTPMPELHPFVFEAAAEYDPTPSIKMRAGWNVASIKNLPLYQSHISPDSTYTWAVASPDSVLKKENLTRHILFAESVLTPAPFFQISLNVKVRSFNDHLAYQPFFDSSFMIDYRSERYFNARLNWSIIGERYADNSRSSKPKPTTLEGYQMLNIDLSRRVYQNITAIARGHNLTDATTEIWQDYKPLGQMFFLGAMIEF
ncbi:MAG: hypothetical protein B6244_06710 [Candidatus Cloacimonetes bacterium 4572_55]|nr:MAG: hypothetical protein B6244_06710 [Candidatus Cloacimonetes bacterium 4572_55]